jgi:hypothetical protein
MENESVEIIHSIIECYFICLSLGLTLPLVPSAPSALNAFGGSVPGPGSLAAQAHIWPALRASLASKRPRTAKSPNRQIADRQTPNAKRLPLTVPEAARRFESE